MNRFDYIRAGSVAEAVQAGAAPHAAYLAGGTNLVDLMKENVARPRGIVDINRLHLATIEETEDGGLRLGALVTNADTAYETLASNGATPCSPAQSSPGPAHNCAMPRPTAAT